MRKKKWALLIPLVLIIAYLAGPHPSTPVYSKDMPPVPVEPVALEKYIQQQEAAHKLKPDNEARIVWANDSLKNKMGSMGDIEGDMTHLTLTDFGTGVKTSWSLNTDHHGGGDWRLVANFIQAVSKKDAGLLTSTIDVSIESHIMCFMAEQSLLQKKVVDLVM